MAFSEAQRLDIRFYLGWSDRYFHTDSRLEMAMNGAEARADTVTKVVELLVSLNLMWKTTLPAAYSRLKATQVGSITLPGSGEIQMLRSEGRRTSGALASLLGVGVRHNVWSATAPTDFAGYYGVGTWPGGGGGGGNYYPHG